MKIAKSIDHRRINVEGRIIVAHQAEFLPWLGFISKATMGDAFLILDDTQFKKKYFENRNKIRFPNKDGWLWLNIPVKEKDKLPNMMNVKVNGEEWKEKHLTTLKYSYAKTPYFDQIYPEVYDLYSDFQSDKLVDINIKLIHYAFKKFDISLPVYRVSDLKANGLQIEGNATNLVLSLAKSVEADAMVVGVSGKDYLEPGKFSENNIQLLYQDFNHPVYKQYHGDFLPYMSFLDILFNHGEAKSRAILGMPSYKFP